MAKLFVRLANPSNSLKKDNGERFEPYKVHEVEDSQRMLDAVAHNMLEKVPASERPKKKEDKVEEPAGKLDEKKV